MRKHHFVISARADRVLRDGLNIEPKDNRETAKLDAATYGERELRRVPGVGETVLTDIKEWLLGFNLALKDEPHSPSIVCPHCSGLITLRADKS